MELIVLAVGLLFLIAIPILIVKALVGLVLLPFKLVAVVFKLVFGAFALVAKLLFGGLGLLLGLAALVVGLIFLPLLPFLAIGGLIWLIVRASRPRPALRLPA
ncbi:MAG TPA: hypothetical protein VJU18_13295 [Vicinamibacteria bacterium]|nr:hypothetical protein [Vicinamibacteria bacterium]